MLEFWWEVYQEGYQWENVELWGPYEHPPKPPFLTAGPFRRRWSVMYYQALRQYTGLFRDFVATAPTKEGIRVFANKYGLLGGDITYPIVFRTPQSPNDVEPGHGEPLSAWIREILVMRQVVTLWDLAHAGDVKGLSQYIHWREEGVLYDSHPHLEEKLPLPIALGILHFAEENGPPLYHRRAWIATSTAHPELLQQFSSGDVVQPARYYVQRGVNEYLQGHVSARLLWADRRTRLDLCFVPESLKDALWLQFAHAIAGNKDYRPCVECATWFELSPKVARADKRYCSRVCRNRAYQQRVAQAQALFAEGVTLEKIARQLDTGVKEVEGWSARKRSTGRRGRKPKGTPATC
jgi:hypothetical protein